MWQAIKSVLLDMYINMYDFQYKKITLFLFWGQLKM